MAAIDASRALALVGTPFRLQGRGSDGLDCVGLCLSACSAPSAEGRRDYRLRGDHWSEIEAALLFRFRKVRRRDARPGDLVVMQVSAEQLHLGIMTERGFVHADARLRRVVETPGKPSWPVRGYYRRRRELKR